MDRKAGIARQITREVRGELTLRSIVLFVVGTVAGLFVASLIMDALGRNLPWWLMILATAGALLMRFGKGLKPGRYNPDA